MQNVLIQARNIDSAVVYHKFTINEGNSNWEAGRVITIPLNKLQQIGMSENSIAKVSINNRYNNMGYVVQRTIEISGRLADFGTVCCTSMPKGPQNIALTTLARVDSSGITIVLGSDDYTREACIGEIIVERTSRTIS